ncbi:uncharacterized protein [Paralichthys olivaceus]|uniref:uncharacterized protein n=1 Tax=Paralichthys olivaceus TaxID=8255 RepID=UPI003750AA0B
MGRKGHNAKYKLRLGSVFHHVESPAKHTEVLCDEIKHLKSENLELAHQIESLKIMMSCKEPTWNKTQATLADLEDEVKDLKLQVKDRDKFLRKMSCRPRYTQLFETERVKEELHAKLNQIRLMELSFNKKMEDMISEKDAVIAKVTQERVALEHQNLELVTELTVIQTEVVSNQSEWKTEIPALEDSVKTEQEVKEACTEKMEDTEEKCVAKQEDILNQARSIEEDVELLMDKNTELQEPAWKTVNTKAGSRKKRRKNQRCK